MLGQKTDHLARHLQGRHPTVEIDPVKTLQIQPNMPAKDVIHGHNMGGHGAPPQRVSLTPTLASPDRHVTYPTRPPSSAVRCAAPLDNSSARLQ
jgi:hypothetical protein